MSLRRLLPSHLLPWPASLPTPPSCPRPCSDSLVGEVGRELDNGRMLRLLSKLTYCCDRPELNGDTQWAETGDRCGGWAARGRWRKSGRRGGVGPALLRLRLGVWEAACRRRQPASSACLAIDSPGLAAHAATLLPSRYLLKLFRDLLFHQVRPRGV